MILAGVNMTIPTALQASLTSASLSRSISLLGRSSFAIYVTAAVLQCYRRERPGRRLVAAAFGRCRVSSLPLPSGSS